MAPKKNVLSKKQRSNAVSSYRNPIPFDDSRFICVEQEGRYREIANRRIWVEKRVSLNSEGDYRLMDQQLALRKWGNLINPHKNLNHDIVQEFYANAFSYEEEVFSFTSMVRGRFITFNRNAINEFLGIPPIVKEGGSCPHGKYLKRPLNIKEISAVILLEDRSLQLNTLEVPIRYKKDDLTPFAQAYLFLFLHNIRHIRHTSTFPLDTENLQFQIVKGRHVDVTCIIAGELKMVVESGH
ncbi:unnamed protein product [Lathyrus oleraceus]